MTAARSSCKTYVLTCSMCKRCPQLPLCEGRSRVRHGRVPIYRDGRQPKSSPQPKLMTSASLATPRYEACFRNLRSYRIKTLAALSWPPILLNSHRLLPLETALSLLPPGDYYGTYYKGNVHLIPDVPVIKTETGAATSLP